MKQVDVKVQKRDQSGKGSARASRRAGRIPAIVYGGKDQPVSVSVDRLEMERALKRSSGESENIIVNVVYDDNDTKDFTIVRETQHDPLSGELEHLDFFRISVDKKIATTVSLHPVGASKGVKAGGVFELILREVEVECLPLEIPNYIEFDVSNLDIGETLHVSDIPENPLYTILTAPERTIASITKPESATAPAEGLEEGAEEGAEEGTEEASEESKG